MRSSLRFWLALSILLGAGAIILWVKTRPEAETQTMAWSNPPQSVATSPALMNVPAMAANLATAPASTPSSTSATNGAVIRPKYQLSNTPESIRKLTRVETAVLMKNALIDTRRPVDLDIPESLRATDNPGAYIVQASGAPRADFQKMLRDAGAEIVSYVPNNAFLVKADKGAADVIRGQGGVQAVLPYEPYYKLDPHLMKHVVEAEPMADDAWLRVTLFPGASDADLNLLANAVGLREKSPFGDQILVQPRAGSLASIAQLGAVQIVEPYTQRVPANDLSRVRLGVAANTTNANNYFGLSGQGIWVNVNDFGVDSTHPALAGRMFYSQGNGSTDFEGHGTHVAGIIAGGPNTNIFDNLGFALTNNPNRFVTNTVTDDSGNVVTNVLFDGSLTNADFRGIAYNSKLFILPISFSPEVNQPVTDTYLIETAAQTNYVLFTNKTTLISNNSWNYANISDYDSQAARFDAATRDALPENPGSQPVVYVFAAGNQGFGDEDGTGGEPGRISSPGTAKNVITVGALEQLRTIAETLTNVTTEPGFDDNGQPTNVLVTNLVQVFLPITDSDNEVAAFSSRGNVGIGVEGAFGRFKPDLVAPGTFVWSARSTNWDLLNDYPTNDPTRAPYYNVFSNLDAVSTKYRYESGTSMSAADVSGFLALVQEFFTKHLSPEKRRNLSPAMMKALVINSARSVSPLYDYNPQTEKNLQGWGLPNLTTALGMDFNEQSTFDTLKETDWPIQLIDQSPTNAIATGEDRVWTINLNTNSMHAPLRFTLVWTDPPGNPQVGLKLVNDLDLTVEAGDTVFFGNDFQAGTVESTGRDPRPTDEWPLDNPYRDTVNNVEQVIIGQPNGLRNLDGSLVTNITVRVSGRRVNVKAISDYYSANGTAATNDIVQDFALVMSSDNTALTNVFKTITRQDKVDVNTNVLVQPMFNGVEATNQRVGANPSLYGTNGNKVQWKFYTFTNAPTLDTENATNFGRYVAFIVSGPINLSSPRNIEPDVDLYVSKDPNLTNLLPAAVNGAWKSVSQLGTEQIIFAPDDIIRDDNNNPTTNRADLYPLPGGVITNAVDIGDTLYIAVKSEDQMAAEYTLIGLSSEGPFERDRGGVRIVQLVPSPNPIPDGSANLPQGRRYYGVPMRGGRVLDASIYAAFRHDEMGDLVGVVGHEGRSATIYNHNLPDGFNSQASFVFSDFPYAPKPLDATEFPTGGLYPFGLPGTVTRSDGPGSFENFIGRAANTAWMFDVIDNSPGHTGTVLQAELHIRPLQKPLLNGLTVSGTVGANGQVFYPVEVGNDATKVTVTLTLTSGANDGVQLLVRKDFIPSTNLSDVTVTGFEYDYGTTLSNGQTTVTLTFDRGSSPPLIPGEYFVGIINPTGLASTFDLTVTIDTSSTGVFDALIGNTFIDLKDDARTSSVGNTNLAGAPARLDYRGDKVVTEAAVEILATKERVSDLTLRLRSPQGTTILLAENRGAFSTNFGSAVVTTNAINNEPVSQSYLMFTDDLGLPIKFTPPPFSDSSATRGFVSGSSFEGSLAGAYTTGQRFDKWTVTSANPVYVVAGGASDGNNYVNLGDRGAISNTLALVKGRSYKLKFDYRGKPTYTRVFDGTTAWEDQPQIGAVYSTGQIDTGDALGTHTNAPQGTVDSHFSIINNPDANFPPAPGESGTALFIAQTNAAPFPNWFADDTNSQWLAMMPQNDSGHPAGSLYTNRTMFALAEADATAVRVNARVAADGTLAAVYVNGKSAAGAPVGQNNQGYSPRFVLSGFANGLNTIDFVVQTPFVPAPKVPEGFRAQLSMAIVQATPPTNVNQVVTNGPTAGFMRLTALTFTNTLSVSGAGAWQTAEVEFIADTNAMPIEFFADKAFPGVDIDNVILEDTGTVFVQPEEPLSILQGERAMGEWTLEAIDNRTGATNNAAILDWHLILGVADAPRLAEELFAGVVYGTNLNTIHNTTIKNDPSYTPGRIVRGETEWFYYDICDSASVATISLLGAKANTGSLELLVDRSGFPTGDPERDDYVILRTTPGEASIVSMTLWTNIPIAAPLQHNHRLFIAVRNAEFFTTNQFSLTIRGNGCAPKPQVILTAGQAADAVSFPAVPGDDGDSFLANTTGPTNVTLNLKETGNLVVLASNGVDPTTNSYQVKLNATSGSATLSLPSGGSWFIRVINQGDTAVPYSIVLQGASGSNVRNVSIAGGHLTVTWTSVVGQSYELSSSTDLVNWTTLTTVQANSSQTTYTDPQAATGTARFIRIRPL